MNKNYTTVIFDLDGTLLDTLADLADSVNYVMRLHGLPIHTIDQVRAMVGNGIYVLLERAIPGGRQFPAFDTCAAEFQEHYKLHMQDKTGPFPGILPLLQRLTQEGCKLAVVSNKFDAAVKALCRDYFGSLIPVAIGEHEAAGIAKKPAPDTVLEAMKQLGAEPSSCVYVGDSDVDIETAKNSEIPCISVTWGFRSREFLTAHGAVTLAEDAEDLYRKLREPQPPM